MTPTPPCDCSAQRQLIEIAGAGHMLDLEAPERFQAAVEGFLA